MLCHPLQASAQISFFLNMPKLHICVIYAFYFLIFLNFTIFGHLFLSFSFKNVFNTWSRPAMTKDTREFVLLCVRGRCEMRSVRLIFFIAGNAFVKQFVSLCLIRILLIFAAYTNSELEDWLACNHLKPLEFICSSETIDKYSTNISISISL